MKQGGILNAFSGSLWGWRHSGSSPAATRVHSWDLPWIVEFGAFFSVSGLPLLLLSWEIGSHTSYFPHVFSVWIRKALMCESSLRCEMCLAPYMKASRSHEIPARPKLQPPTEIIFDIFFLIAKLIHIHHRKFSRGLIRWLSQKTASHASVRTRVQLPSAHVSD